MHKNSPQKHQSFCNRTCHNNDNTLIHSRTFWLVLQILPWGSSTSSWLRHSCALFLDLAGFQSRVHIAALGGGSRRSPFAVHSSLRNILALVCAVWLKKQAFPTTHLVEMAASHLSWSLQSACLWGKGTHQLQWQGVFSLSSKHWDPLHAAKATKWPQYIVRCINKAGSTKKLRTQ